MDIDLLQWLLIGLPVAFALGWAASRLDLRQLRRADRDSPKAYFKGLNLLLNEQQDKAIDAFIEAVQHDPETAELHFALGNLFRRRGEFERAVRVHQHLLGRGDLKPLDRHRAQHALAQDYMKAGLFDRAEAAWRALEGTSFEPEARLAQLTLAERSRDWPRAIEVATQIQQAGAGTGAKAPDFIGDLAARIAHHECERAHEAAQAGRQDDAEQALLRARHSAPAAPRPLLQLGQGHATAGRHDAAYAAWDELRASGHPAFLLIASDFARSAAACGQAAAARAALQTRQEQSPANELLMALDVLDSLEPARAANTAHSAQPTQPTQPPHPSHATSAARWTEQLRRQPTLGAARELLALDPAQWGEDGLATIRQAVSRAAAPLQRYRCAACGFDATHYFWQCPACLGWETYPPQRLEQQ